MGLGIKALILLIVLVAVASAAHAVISSYNTALEEAATQKAVAERTAEERDGWIDVAAQQENAKHRADEALKERARANKRLQEERDRARAELSDLRKKPENVAWLDQPLPPDIAAWLRGPAGAKPPSPEGGRSRTATVPSGTVPSPAVRR